MLTSTTSSSVSLHTSIMPTDRFCVVCNIRLRGQLKKNARNINAALRTRLNVPDGLICSKCRQRQYVKLTSGKTINILLLK